MTNIMEHNKCAKEKYNAKVNSFYNKFIKRILDLLFSIILIFFLLPVILLLTIIQFITSGFPIFYRPFRGGYKNKPFRILKFRTMVKNADKIGGGTTAFNDRRITKFGNFLRKTKLDEIPQIFNVFIGQMSFIGPRPELIKYTEQYDDLEKFILYVKPGISDYSSLKFINLDEIVGEKNAEVNYEKKVLEKKNILRLQYVEEICFFNDLKIFAETIFKVMKKAIRVIIGVVNGKN